MADGAVLVRGVPASTRPLADIAAVPYRFPARLPADQGPGIEATFDFAIPDGGWSQATHCCWVDVDVHTGLVTIDRYLVVEDCGTLINPMIVEGQISGGVAQGIGGVLYERAIYDDQAQLLTSTFVDYLLPTSAEIPLIEIHHLESPPQGPIDFPRLRRRRRDRRARRAVQRDRRRAAAVRRRHTRAVPAPGAHPRTDRRHLVP